MRTVTRHETDADHAEKQADWLAGRMSTFIDLAGKTPDALRSVLTRSQEELGYRCVTDPTAASIETWDSAVLAMQSSAAIFEAARTPGGEVTVRLGGETITTTGTGPNMNAAAATWLTALYLAMICRERARIGLLAAVPVDLLRRSGLEYDDFLYSWVLAWQTYWREEDSVVDRLLEAMRGTDPDTVRHISPEWTLRVYYPPMELFYHLTQRDTEKFNDALANALELHKRHWSADKGHPVGYIALGPLAVACLARDTGMRIEVESDYLPRHLLDGTRVGELST